MFRVECFAFATKTANGVPGGQKYCWETRQIGRASLYQLDPAATYFVHCRSGYRSMVASSIMAAKGFSNIVEIKGGFMAIQKTSIPVTQFVCPNSK